MSTAKYSIGIDLGTTNTLLAYAPVQPEQPQIEILPIAQVVAPGQIESLPSLPSFLYLPSDSDSQSRAMAMPDQGPNEPVVGTFARAVAADRPERVVAAAKSWLCHSLVDRHAAILPWNSEETAKISPVEATTWILKRLVRAWHAAFPDSPIDQQLVTLTVPASFDMAARELTRLAAVAAGLSADFVLLEEPQAAVYHWLHHHRNNWRNSLNAGETLLVVDVGGGTTDLTLVRVEQESGDLVLQRLAVGKHLLVGGDNMDLALAHLVSAKLAGKGVKLNAWQSVSLWHSCRKAKESLLSSPARTKESITVLGRGSRLIGSAVSIDVERDELLQFLVDGFFPNCRIDECPQPSTTSGFHEVGLEFESDSAITRHIAAFLAANSREDLQTPMVTHVLFNGGVFKSAAFRERLQQIIADWCKSSKASQPSQSLQDEHAGQNSAGPNVLGGVEDLDRAVACGAAYYGWSKRHGVLRIRGAAARSYYVGIESSGLAVPGMPRPLYAVCVVPFGMEEGTELDVPGREIGLVVGAKAQFRFFASSSRQQDKVGTILRNWDDEELQETAPLELVLETDQPSQQGFVPVRFQSRISELGVFELWCTSSAHARKWKLEFNVRQNLSGV